MLKNSKKFMLKLEIRANYNYEKKIKSTEIRYQKLKVYKNCTMK